MVVIFGVQALARQQLVAWLIQLVQSFAFWSQVTPPSSVQDFGTQVPMQQALVSEALTMLPKQFSALAQTLPPSEEQVVKPPPVQSEGQLATVSPLSQTPLPHSTVAELIEALTVAVEELLSESSVAITEKV